MTIRNTETQYGSVAKFFHWVVFLFVVSLLCVGFYMTTLDDEQTKASIYMMHKSFGLTVLSLMILRILWTFMNPKPGYTATTPQWEKTLARSMHFTLYILLLAMPLSGWLMSTAAGYAPNVFGLFTLPMPGIPLDKPLAKFASEIHSIIAWAIIVLVVLHMAAAWKHQLIDKDTVLKRMMPWVKI